MGTCCYHYYRKQHQVEECFAKWKEKTTHHMFS